MSRTTETGNKETHWILCVTRNGLPYTREAVKSFLDQDIGRVRVMILDNNSTDGTVQWGLALYPRVVLIPWDKEVSVAKAWNRGLEALFDRGHGKVLVCNNDVELRPETYRYLDEDGGLFVTAVGDDDRERALRPTPPPDPKRKRPHPDFSCYLIRRECWEKVGPFDENFQGAYVEDCDYHCRMHNLGVAACCIDFSYYHAACGTLKSNPREDYRIHRKAEANREYFKAKWGFEVGTPEYNQFFVTRI